jgi:hypothetical protein
MYLLVPKPEEHTSMGHVLGHRGWMRFFIDIGSQVFTSPKGCSSLETFIYSNKEAYI